MRLLRTIGGLDVTGQERAALNKLTMPVKGFRRLKGCGDMRRLVTALRARDQRLGLGVSEANVA